MISRKARALRVLKAFYEHGERDKNSSLADVRRFSLFAKTVGLVLHDQILNGEVRP